MKIAFFQPDDRSVLERRIHEQIEKVVQSELALVRTGHAPLGIANEAILLCGENTGSGHAAGRVKAKPTASDRGQSNEDSGPHPERPMDRIGRASTDETFRPRAPTPGGLGNFSALPDNALVRLPVVCALFSISSATVWRYVKREVLPSPVKLSARVTGWRVGELRARLDSAGS